MNRRLAMPPETQPTIAVPRRASRRRRERTASSLVEDVLRSPGQPLEASTRTFFEPRFGHDFSRVRVHTGARAAASARALGADALTFGEHIVFATARYAADTDAGRRLLGHELAHVVRGADGRPMTGGEQVRLSHASDAEEKRTEDMATRALALGERELRAGANTIVRLRRGPRKEEEPNRVAAAAESPRGVQAGSHRVIWRREAVLPPAPIEENPAVRLVNDEPPGLTSPAINGLTILTGEHLAEALPEPRYVGRPTSGGQFECRAAAPVDVISGTDMIVTTPPGANGWHADASPGWVADNSGDLFCYTSKRNIPVLLRHESNNRTFYNVVRRSEGEHHADVAELHRTILKPYHDRVAAAAATPRTGPNAQDCALAVARQVDWMNTLVNYATAWGAAQQRRDGPGGTHRTDATVTTSDYCLSATITARGE